MSESNINGLPHLTNQEITIKLFNNKFLSDIQFCVSGKIIYAHSLELMKRSAIFQRQLEEAITAQKLIPVINANYDSFLEFMRFIYTDNCSINETNGIDLLKLAIQYQVIALENRVINTLKTVDWIVQLFDYSVVEMYEMARIRVVHYCSVFFDEFIKSKQFVSLHEDAVNELVQINRVKQGVTEMQIFQALASWIINYCTRHQLSLENGGKKFNNLIRQIRFSVMSSSELDECSDKYPELMNEVDCLAISALIMLGVTNHQWISTPRDSFKPEYVFRNFNRNTAFETKLTVSNHMVLYGCQIGVEKNRKDMRIIIIASDIDSNYTEVINFTQSSPEAWWGTLLISFGNSVLLKPEFQYTIVVQYLGIIDTHMDVLCRKADVDLVLDTPENSVRIAKTGENMMQLVFKTPLK